MPSAPIDRGRFETGDWGATVEQLASGRRRADRATEVNGADIAVELSVSADPAPSGRALTWTATVTNNGPLTATSVTLVDTLPTEVIFVSSNPGSPDCTFTAGTLTCDLGTLAPHASAQVAGLALRGLQPGGARAGDALPDAFRSSFDDRDGWWSLARTLTTTEARLEFTKDEPVSRRLTGGEGYAHDRRLEGELAAPLAFLPG